MYNLLLLFLISSPPVMDKLHTVPLKDWEVVCNRVKILIVFVKN